LSSIIIGTIIVCDHIMNVYQFATIGAMPWS